MVLAGKACFRLDLVGCVEQASRVEMQDVIRFRDSATVEGTTRNSATIAVVFWYCIDDLITGACKPVMPKP
jgi:hypothetical protein